MLGSFFLAEQGDMTWMIIGVVILLLFVVFVLPTFTRKKQETQYKTMLDNIKVGYKIKTIGGIVGKVVEVNTNGLEKTFTIETGIGENKSTMVFDIMAIYQVLEPKLTPEMFKKPEAEAKPLASDESKTNSEVIQKEETEDTVQAESKEDKEPKQKVIDAEIVESSTESKPNESESADESSDSKDTSVENSDSKDEPAETEKKDEKVEKKDSEKPAQKRTYNTSTKKYNSKK